MSTRHVINIFHRFTWFDSNTIFEIDLGKVPRKGCVKSTNIRSVFTLINKRSTTRKNLRDNIWQWVSLSILRADFGSIQIRSPFYTKIIKIYINIF